MISCHGGDCRPAVIASSCAFPVMWFEPENRNRQLDEAALYTVKGGKIVRKVFFYHFD